MTYVKTPRKTVFGYEEIGCDLGGMTSKQAAEWLMTNNEKYHIETTLVFGRYDEYDSDKYGIFIRFCRPETDKEMAKRHKQEEQTANRLSGTGEYMHYLRLKEKFKDKS